MSVVPPPISTKATPTSFLSLSTAEDDANGSPISSATSRPALFTHLKIF